VSLGEINATPLLVQGLERKMPDHEVIISTTTDTGFARARQLYGEHRVFRFPLDFSWVVARVLRRVQPRLIVLVELEVWFNLVHAAYRRDIPVAVVNGRLTERSRRRFGWIAGPARSMFSKLAWVGAQDHAIAERFRELGTTNEQVETMGSIKWDSTTVADHVDGQTALARALGISENTPTWVCGSTGPDEEAIILHAYSRVRQTISAVRLVLVPRKPERFSEVAELIRRAGYPCIRRSGHADGTVLTDVTAETIILGDTMGELRKFYCLADVVFVGRSLVPMGGSDPMEVAALARPIIAGPHMENFREPVAALTDAGALITATNAHQLADAVLQMIQDPQRARDCGAKARQVVIQHQGATERTVSRLVALVG
jgi:3-deoxy-D-manno-octulosonic-acid transferase